MNSLLSFKRTMVLSEIHFLKGGFAPMSSSSIRIRLSALVSLLACCLFAFGVAPVLAQSTYGAILGTVRDSTGALVPAAEVKLVNTGTMATRTTVSDAAGNYAFNNIDVGRYALSFSAAGFQTESLPEIVLTARETRRVDAVLSPGAQTQTVVVVEQLENVINTDVSNLAETKVGEELVELPVAIYSRSTGSTSPIDSLTTEAGVQTDGSGNLMVMGTTPALLSVTIDGISSVGVEYSGPVNEMFPSFNSIEEIRVSESNNNAEFSGVADITTVSKAGTNNFHGGVFENLENTALNSGVPLAFANAKPKIVMNDFGGTFGGPLGIPHFYSGKDKTFFFTSFEALRLPRETPILVSVPSADMRNGNIGAYLDQTYCEPDPKTQCPNGYTVYNPDGSVLTNSITNAAVTPSTITANILKYLLPLPNYGAAGSFSNNYQVNFPAPISANQGDVRLDQTISSKQTAFARFSYKNRQVTSAPNVGCTFSFCQTAGGPMQGGYNQPEIDEGMTFAHNYIFTPKLMNEFRGGFNAQHTSATQSFSTTSLLAQTGLTSVPQPDTAWSEAPQVLINGIVATGGGNPTVQRGQIVELLDNVTWSLRNHSLKFGADFKRLTDHDDNVYGNYRSGWYVFNGSSDVVDGTTNVADSTTGLIPHTGEPYAGFLAGYPDYTEVSTTNKANMNGVGYSYAVYGQDDWKVSPNLTVNLGLRYELHPPLRDSGFNTGFFLPDYSATIDGQSLKGAVVVPNSQALSFESSQLVSAISPTPTLTAAQANLPAGLRYTYKQDWGPRLGFAWRPGGSDKTVVRGGWGRFIESPLGFSLVSGFGVDASYVGVYSQPGGATPQLSFSNPFPSAAASSTGTAGFYWAFPIHYTDPSVQQWNLTGERDLGKGIGVRLTYTGSHGSNLETMEDLNQVPANSIGYSNSDPAPAATGACITDDGTLISDHRPYPCWSIIQSVANAAESNYNSGTVEVSRHSGKDFTFNASYTFTRDLSDAEGATPNGLVGVSGGDAGGSYLTDRFHPGLDYGNVAFDRRHRFLVTYLYNLPFGHGERWLNSGALLGKLVGDWQLGGVTILQSGPFLTPYEATNDPAGTNILTTVGQTRADLLPHKSLYPSHRTVGEWLDSPATDPSGSAYSIPAANRGTFGNASVGSVVGPGTQNFSMSLMKGLSLSERTRFQFSLEAANVLNHRNYEPPNMQVDAGNFGTIPALQTAEGAGPRSIEVAGRITF
jgi:hypothetical protein